MDFEKWWEDYTGVLEGDYLDIHIVREAARDAWEAAVSQQAVVDNLEDVPSALKVG